MSVPLASVLVSQLVLVYVSVIMSAARECSPWLYVSVSVTGGFWHFLASVYWTSPFAYIDFLKIYIYFYFNYFYFVHF